MFGNLGAAAVLNQSDCNGDSLTLTFKMER